MLRHEQGPPQGHPYVHVVSTQPTRLKSHFGVPKAGALISCHTRSSTQWVTGRLCPPLLALTLLFVTSPLGQEYKAD